MPSSITPPTHAVSSHACTTPIQYTASMVTPVLQTDIAIIGGGVAGLWALNLLRQRGYSTLLFEHRALGSDQTIASQGIIHGGIKYALDGALNTGSRTIAAMPAAWRRCLDGKGDIDLRGCKVLSEDFYLWSSDQPGARLNSFLASKLLRGRVAAVTAADHPPPLRHSNFRGHVYKLNELVLDVPSLLEALAEPHREAIFSIDWGVASLQLQQAKATLVLPQCTVEAQCLLFCAGAGNESLLQQLGASGPAMQRRPLQQVLVKHQYREPFYAHCMGNRPSPRLTVSSHLTRAGEPVWYLGGDLATAGSAADPQQLIARAREELQQLLPWLELGQCDWRSISLDRAEPRQASLLRPDSAYVGSATGVDNALVAWPTKLTLCPQMGAAIEKQLQRRQILPKYQPDLSGLAGMERPVAATPLWDALFP